MQLLSKKYAENDNDSLVALISDLPFQFLTTAATTSSTCSTVPTCSTCDVQAASILVNTTNETVSTSKCSSSTIQPPYILEDKIFKNEMKHWTNDAIESGTI